jgi:hypothetical protein
LGRRAEGERRKSRAESREPAPKKGNPPLAPPRRGILNVEGRWSRVEGQIQRSTRVRPRLPHGAFRLGAPASRWQVSTPVAMGGNRPAGRRRSRGGAEGNAEASHAQMKKPQSDLPGANGKNRAGNEADGLTTKHTNHTKNGDETEQQGHGKKRSNGQRSRSRGESQIQSSTFNIGRSIHGQPNNFLALMSSAIGPGTCFSQAASPFCSRSITPLELTAR